MGALLQVDTDSLFAQWAAMLYVDGRLGGGDPELSFPSWDLAEIFDGLNPELRLTPKDRAFATFSEALSVHGGSTAYFRLSSAGPRPPFAVRVRDRDGGLLSTTLRPQVWIVRLR